MAYDLTGRTTVEKNFFENFLLPASFEHLPSGMLPMCYPADHNDGDFGPQRPQTKAFPQVYPANAFIGNYLRLELLSRYGLNGQLTREIAGYFLYMADQTGTLWENIITSASCDHGFASHTAHCLYRDTLGIYALNRRKKSVTLRFADVGLDWCRGTLPTPEGPVRLSWRTDRDTIIYSLALPAGYTLTIQNISDRRLKRE